MARKHKHPEHENLERWLVSYADFITLLFATFTALFAIASADLAKYKDVAAAISKGFQQQSLISGIKSIIQGKSPPSDNPNPMSQEKGAGDGVIGEYESMTYLPGEIKAAKQTAKELRDTIQEINQQIYQIFHPDDSATEKATPKTSAEKTPQDSKQAHPPTNPKDTPPEKPDKKDHPPQQQNQSDLTKKEKQEETPTGIGLSLQERGINVSFDSSMLFESGSARLRPEAKKFLDQVAVRLQKYSGNNRIQVEGHTDDTPIATAIYPSNWELSTARASAVVRYFIAVHHFDPKYMSAVGYADSRPIASNMTPAGRQKNRRIDIVLFSKMEGKRVDPKSQYQQEATVIEKTPTEKPVTGKGLVPVTVEKSAPGGPGKSRVEIIFQEDVDPTFVKPKIQPIEGTRSPKPPEPKSVETSHSGSASSKGHH